MSNTEPLYVAVVDDDARLSAGRWADCCGLPVCNRFPTSPRRRSWRIPNILSSTAWCSTSISAACPPALNSADGSSPRAAPHRSFVSPVRTIPRHVQPPSGRLRRILSKDRLRRGRSRRDPPHGALSRAFERPGNLCELENAIERGCAHQEVDRCRRSLENAHLDAERRGFNQRVNRLSRSADRRRRCLQCDHDRPIDDLHRIVRTP